MIDTGQINAQIDLMLEAEKITNMRHKCGQEYAGPCPMCGGKDRFVVSGDKWLCRHCTTGKWRDGISFIMQTRNLNFRDACNAVQIQSPLTPQERERIAAERAERAARELEESIKRANEALRELREAQAWSTYHRQLENDTQARMLWRNRGVPDVYQDLFSFGYDPRHEYYSDGQQHISASLTIPVFQIGGECVNVRHRLLKPVNKNDKYRPERSGLPASPWFADPDNRNPDRVLIVEGEIKAAVSYITADDSKMQVIGMPGKSNGIELIGDYLDTVDGPIYLCPDPDAVDIAHIEAAKIGDRARLIELPDKIDDLITRYSLGKGWMQSTLRQARRL